MWVIGDGRIGRGLKVRADAAELPCELLTRTSGWAEMGAQPGAPVIVATRNDDLAEVVAKVPVHRRQDLVFIQNGMLRPWLREHTLAQATRGLLYWAVTERGSAGTPGRASPFCGPHAQEVAGWLSALGVTSWSVDWARFSYYEVEKLVWIAAFGPLCERHDTDVGGVVTDHREALEALTAELNRMCRVSMGVDVPTEHLVAKLVDYSLTIPTYRGAVKEWRWRNGWFVHEARRYGIATPTHDRLLAELGR
ncbi:MAG: hypothetical protein JXX28_02030 [Deltaproteobacteria bacterium]|nr:hypothetical protein [Deltaproteobacteria bacterium]